MNALDRLTEGRARFARLLKALLARNRLSHAGLKAFHDWAEPDQRTWLSTSQISGLRTSKLRAPGPRAFDSLGQINLRLAQLLRVDAPAVRTLTPLPPGLPSDLKHLADSAWFAPRPDTGLPMDAGDLFLVWLGRLDPQVEDRGYSDREARAVCERLALLVQAWLADRSLLPSNGRTQIEEFYAPTASSAKERIWTALMGGAALGGEELAEVEDSVRSLLGRLSTGARELSPYEWDRWVAGAEPPRT